MSILVTGGAGFIGANFVLAHLQQHDEQIINLDKLTYAGNLDNVASLQGDDRHIFIQGDITDCARVANILAEYRPRAVINFAAESHVDRSIGGPGAFIHTNVVGTFHLLDAVRAYWQGLSKHSAMGANQQDFRFLHISTDEVYGSLEPGAAAFSEMHRYEPNSPYSASKAASDHLVRAYHHTYGLPVMTTNCSNNYGPYQYPEKLIPLVICRALGGQPLPIYGDGQQVRDWLHVSDHCRAISRVLEAGCPGEVYNIGGLNQKTNLEVVHNLCDSLDRLYPASRAGLSLSTYRSLLAFVDDRPGHDRRYAMDITKIKQKLGWEPAETFASGIEKTVQWYLDHQKWVVGAVSKSSVNQAECVEI